MSSPIAIPRAEPAHRYDPYSTSPTMSTSPLQRMPFAPGFRPKVLKPFATTELRILLLENISLDAANSFKAQGFQVDLYPGSWGEQELIEKIGNYHAIGIRSKTKLTEKVLKAATKVSGTIP